MSLFDMGSDVALGIDYCVTDNPWWCGLTWGFVAVPLIIGICVLVPYFLYTTLCLWCQESDSRKECLDLQKDFPQLLTYLKVIEICLESGPQLLLQLYIIAVTTEDPSAITGTLSTKKIIPLVHIKFTF